MLGFLSSGTEDWWEDTRFIRTPAQIGTPALERNIEFVGNDFICNAHEFFPQNIAYFNHQRALWMGNKRPRKKVLDSITPLVVYFWSHSLLDDHSFKHFHVESFVRSIGRQNLPQQDRKGEDIASLVIGLSKSHFWGYQTLISFN